MDAARGKRRGMAMGACALRAYAVAFCAAAVLPETSGTDLRAASPEATGQTAAPRPRASWRGLPLEQDR